MKPIVAFVLAGIVGGAVGFLLALVVQPFPEHPITVAAPVLAVAAPFLVAAASIAGGVLAAWFLTLLILSWAPALPVPALRRRQHAWRSVVPCLPDALYVRPSLVKTGDLRG
jgi:hypothetical protein